MDGCVKMMTDVTFVSSNFSPNTKTRQRRFYCSPFPNFAVAPDHNESNEYPPSRVLLFFPGIWLGKFFPFQNFNKMFSLHFLVVFSW